MNTKRLLLAIVVLFVAVFLTNFLIHGVWLQSTYKETMSLWRTESEMQARFGWMLLGQFLFAATFAAIWAAGFAERQCARCACFFGLLMALFSQAGTVINYVVTPLPPSLAVKWFVAGVVQGLVMGVLVYFAYKPKAAESNSKEQRSAPAAV
ncbi:MAG: hypothetical protein ACREUU_21250 [Gammaproteobacteria bacterium]